MKKGIKIDKIYYCPHDYKKETCNCRKPKIGMALQAKKDFPDIDFKTSMMLGDSFSDVEFGRKVGMRSFLIGEKGDFKDLYELANYLENIL